MSIYAKLNSHYKNLTQQIQNIEQELTLLPPGHLICNRNGTHYKWYHSNEHTYTYIPKKNALLASQLAQKNYLSSLLSDLQQKKKAIELCLKEYSKPSSVDLLLSNPEFQTLLAPYFTPLSQDLSNWMNSSYEQNPKHPEHLIHKSTSGHLLRSKSEAIIDMFLFMHKIPFRYECALLLGELKFYPDFTIRHPRTGTLYYWEHFGLMDNPTYSQNTYSKLQLYTTNGIIPSVQLITTFETKDHPIDADTINKIIEHYFL